MRKRHRTLTVTRQQEDNQLSLPRLDDCKTRKDTNYCITKQGQNVQILFIMFVIIVFVCIYLRNRYEQCRDFQQCGILTSVDSDKPVQPPFRLRNIK